MSEAVYSPWNIDQVASLNAYQSSGVFHPYTCGNRCVSDRGDDGVLVATPEGWICPECGYTQAWALAWMTDWSWRKP